MRRRPYQHRARPELARSHPVATAIAKQQMDRHMTTISIAIYLMADGEPPRDLLAHLGWMIGIGAEIAALLTPGTAAARRLHAALRTVVAMGEADAWQAAQAPMLSDAANEAKALMVRYPDHGMRLIPGADWIAAQIRDGSARLDHVAGAELYATPSSIQSAGAAA